MGAVFFDIVLSSGYSIFNSFLRIIKLFIYYFYSSMGKTFSRILAGATAAVAFTLAATPAFAQSYYDYTYSAGDAAAATAFGGLSFVWAICVCCVPLIVDSVIAYLVYKDAKKHNIENAGLWAALCFFFTVIGLLVYFLVPRAEAMKKKEGSSEKKAE